MQNRPARIVILNAEELELQSIKIFSQAIKDPKFNGISSQMLAMLRKNTLAPIRHYIIESDINADDIVDYAIQQIELELEFLKTLYPPVK